MDVSSGRREWPRAGRLARSSCEDWPPQAMGCTIKLEPNGIVDEVLQLSRAAMARLTASASLDPAACRLPW
ncbi:unnamed protein product [Urochloa humidicola]